jgi:hypothetical protein
MKQVSLLDAHARRCPSEVQLLSHGHKIAKLASPHRSPFPSLDSSASLAHRYTTQRLNRTYLVE